MQTMIQPNRPWKTALLTGLLTALLAAPAFAQQMNYQGRLTDASGNAVPDAQYSITFDIYDAATGGAKLWGPQVIPADTVQGRFNVILGPTDTASRNIINAFDGGTTRYLQITLGNNPPILPRQQILAAPVAFRAMISDTVTNGAIGTAQIADGSITAEKINGGTGVWVGNGQNIYRLNGNVGIGTANPAFLLHVQDPGTNTTGRIHVGSRSAGGTPKLISFGDGNFVTLGENGQDDTLELKGSRIYMIGNVGLGITNPTVKLDVQGSIQATGDIQATGNIVSGGKSVVASDETNLRILRGRGTANVTVTGNQLPPLSGVGSGFTYKKLSPGVVDVTFTTPFGGAPCVTANAITAGSTFCGLEGLGGGGNPSINGFRIIMYDTGANGRDWPFNFIAIGPR